MLFFKKKRKKGEYVNARVKKKSPPLNKNKGKFFLEFPKCLLE